MKTLSALGLVAALGLFAAACGDGGKAAAEAAMTAAQSSYDAVKADAAQYVPDQARSVEDALAAARDLMTKENYTQALTEAQALPAKISALGEAAAAKKTELTTAWSGLSAALPAAVESIQTRVAELTKARRLPTGITKDAFEGAKSGLDTITATWTQATEAFSAGNVTDAVNKAQTVKAKAAEVMASLGMEIPDALK